MMAMSGRLERRGCLSAKMLCRCLLVLVVTFLAACVTTEKSVFTGKASKEDAIEARVSLAISYLRKNNTKMAIRHLNTALEIDDKSPRVHEILGIAFQQSGEVELAEKHYLLSLKYDPTYSRGRNNYATFLFSQERYEEAMKQFQQVVEDVYYDGRASAFNNLGLSAIKVGESEIAEEAFKRALGLDRRRPDSLFGLAQIYFGRGEYALSQRYLDQYRSVVNQVSPQSLLLGIRLAEYFDDKNTIASYSMVLKNLYPKSKEFLELKEMQRQN
jgi:type IV pilus assembly protein PilF